MPRKTTTVIAHKRKGNDVISHERKLKYDAPKFGKDDLPSNLRERKLSQSEDIDETAARELLLYIENDASLYNQMYLPIVKNMTSKKASGKYHHELATKGFMHLADEGARRYNKEYGDGENSLKLFNKSTRGKVSKDLRDSFESEYDDGNFDDFIPKKYKKDNWVIYHNGIEKARVGSQKEAFIKLQGLQPFSWSHAMEHEGWSIKRVSE